jgi:hypothetical protein
LAPDRTVTFGDFLWVRWYSAADLGCFGPGDVGTELRAAIVDFVLLDENAT